MKNVVGVPARAENFFPRLRELAAIEERLQNGEHILIDSPRREGKTSLVLSLKDQQFNGDLYAYLDTGAVHTEAEFFRKLYKELCATVGEYVKGRHVAGKGQKFLHRVKSFEVSGLFKVELTENEPPTDHKEDVLSLLKAMKLPDRKQLIIILDEFPQTLLNIIINNPDDLEPARKFLQSARELRTHPSISPKVKFIITGSVGLQHIVAGIGCSSLTADLGHVKFGQLTTNEAKHFLRRLLSTRKVTIPSGAADHLLNKIEWLSPYHIQLMVQQLIPLTMNTQDHVVTVELVDEAFERIASERNNSYFQHYHNRLSRLFKGTDLKYVLEVLNGIAKRGILSKNTVLRLSDKYETQMPWHALMYILVYDGYVNSIGESNAYRFNSPIVREWWKQFVCK